MFVLLSFFYRVRLRWCCLMCLPCCAFGFPLWGFDVYVQNQLRQQSFMLAKERAYRMLPEANGGPSYNVTPLYDPSVAGITCSNGQAVVYPNQSAQGGTINATLGYLTPDALKYGATCQGVAGQTIPIYAGNINADDWRLNFDKGDMLQAPLSLNTIVDIRRRLSFGELAGQIRLEALYDQVLNDSGRFARSSLNDDGLDAIARYATVDAFATLKARVAENRALNIIAGQQEIYWGERSFLPGGIAWFNPLDVPRFRQTGYDYGVTYVNALYSEFIWSRSLSLAGYVGGWEGFSFDVPGTYAGVGGDIWRQGARPGGNQSYLVLGGGMYASGNSWPCAYNDANSWQGNSVNSSTKQYADALKNYAPSCPGPADVLTPVTLGLAEKQRIDSGDSWAMIPHVADEQGRQSFGVMAQWKNRLLNWGVQVSAQSGDSRVPMINTFSDQPSVMPTATGVMDGVIARGATLSGLGLLLMQTGSPYNPAYKNVKLNTSNALMQTLKNDTSLDGYGAPSGSVAEMNALQYQMALAQKVSVTPSTPQGFEAAGATYTGAISIKPNLNMGVYGVYPHEDVYGLSAKYIGFGDGQSPLFFNIAYRPQTPLQFDVSELMIAGVFNNCLMSSTGVYEPALLNKEPYHNEFDLGLGQQKVGCRDYRTVLEGYTKHYDGWVMDFVGQGLLKDKRMLWSDRLFGRLQMRTVYAGGISERANMSEQAVVNGVPVTAPLMPLDNLCVSGSDLPLAALIGFDPRPPVVCRPTEYSMGLVVGGGVDYYGVQIFGKPYTLTPGVFYSRGLVGRSPRPLGVWLKNVGYYMLGMQLKNNQSWSYDLQYRGYFGPAMYNSEYGNDALVLSMTYTFNVA